MQHEQAPRRAGRRASSTLQLASTNHGNAATSAGPSPTSTPGLEEDVRQALFESPVLQSQNDHFSGQKTTLGKVTGSSSPSSSVRVPPLRFPTTAGEARSSSASQKGIRPKTGEERTKPRSPVDKGSRRSSPTSTTTTPIKGGGTTRVLHVKQTKPRTVDRSSSSSSSSTTKTVKGTRGSGAAVAKTKPRGVGTSSPPKFDATKKRIHGIMARPEQGDQEPAQELQIGGGASSSSSSSRVVPPPHEVDVETNYNNRNNKSPQEVRGRKEGRGEEVLQAQTKAETSILHGEERTAQLQAGVGAHVVLQDQVDLNSSFSSSSRSRSVMVSPTPAEGKKIGGKITTSKIQEEFVAFRAALLGQNERKQERRLADAFMDPNFTTGKGPEFSNENEVGIQDIPNRRNETSLQPQVERRETGRDVMDTEVPPISTTPSSKIQAPAGPASSSTSSSLLVRGKEVAVTDPSSSLTEVAEPSPRPARSGRTPTPNSSIELETQEHAQMQNTIVDGVKKTSAAADPNIFDDASILVESDEPSPKPMRPFFGASENTSGDHLIMEDLSGATASPRGAGPAGAPVVLSEIPPTEDCDLTSTRRLPEVVCTTAEQEERVPFEILDRSSGSSSFDSVQEALWRQAETGSVLNRGVHVEKSPSPSRVLLSSDEEERPDESEDDRARVPEPSPANIFYPETAPDDFLLAFERHLRPKNSKEQADFLE
ncbi:unnamed protein product [Amoebophrya sp. A25]|nr:unnamed protein product [Amoebophrya sp. A25]|eukprot:GSA25T00019681001.1